MWKPLNIIFYKTTLKLLYYINYCIKHWQKIITSISGRFWGSWSGMLWRRSAPRPPGCQSWGGCCLGIWGSTPNAVSAGLNSRKWTSGTECGTRTGSTTGGAEGAGPPGEEEKDRLSPKKTLISKENWKPFCEFICLTKWLWDPRAPFCREETRVYSDIIVQVYGRN